MTFPADFDSIEEFEIRNQVSICIYALNEENEIRRSKEPNLDYMNRDVIYLLTIEYGEAYHYVYIKSIRFFF